MSALAERTRGGESPDLEYNWRWIVALPIVFVGSFWQKAGKRTSTAARIWSAEISRGRFLQARPEHAVVIAFLCLFLMLIVRTAWMSDDAFFTFRTISNFAAGHGLVWNVGERVQIYTHPLWMFVLASAVFFTHEFFYTGLAVSILVSITAAVVFARWIASTPMVAVLGIATMIISKAYLDYSTSGLENPLSHLLAVTFLAVYFGARGSRWRILALFVIAALAALNRPDLLLIYLPSLLYVLWEERSWGAVGLAGLGLLPLIIWEVFSLIYYGFPLPNTAYAKLLSGIPPSELLEQGLYYMLNSANVDPITLVIILVGLLVSVFLLRGSSIPIAIGVILYLAYTVRIGGDFMSGRFLTVPLLVGISLLCRLQLPDRWALTALVLVVAAGLAAPSPTLLTLSDYGESRGGAIDGWGVADERAVYSPATALFQARRHVGLPNHPWVDEGISAGQSGARVIAQTTSGIFSFYAGRDVHVIDLLGLGDPLIARLPAYVDPYWRIGHFERILPEGYAETLESGENRIADPNLAKYYDALRRVISGPLISVDRLRDIVRFNLGYYDHLIDAYVESLPLRVSILELSTDNAGAPSTEDQAIEIPTVGVRVDLGGLSYARGVRVHVDRNADYQVIFTRADEEVTRKLIAASTDVQPIRVGISAQAAQEGYDAITLHPVDERGAIFLYSVALLEE